MELENGLKAVLDGGSGRPVSLVQVPIRVFEQPLWQVFEVACGPLPVA